MMYRTYNKPCKIIVNICAFLLILYTLNHFWGSGLNRRCSNVPRHIIRDIVNPSAPRLILKVNQNVNEAWQAVTSSGDIFVYSAFYEKNFRDRIRIVGAITKTASRDLFCIFWYKSKGIATTYSLTRAYVTNINEEHHERFTAAYFICEVCGRHVPDMVSLVDEAQLHGPLNMIEVRNQITTTTQFNMSACISPMFSKSRESNNEHLIEWFEVNQVLGVQFFTVYVQSQSEIDIKVLNYYQSLGKVEIMNWTLGDDHEKPSNKLFARDIHYNGQLAALNDCLYRNKGRSRHTIAIDLDELIVPQRPQDVTLADMLRDLPDKSIYMFRHSYFKRLCDNGSLLCLINNHERVDEVWPPASRSKLIFKAEDVVTIGIHNTWAALAQAEEYVVDFNIGLLHHYKSYDSIYIVNERITANDATGIYHKTVTDRINRTLSYLFE